jgi:hypothetical protein
MPDSMRPLFRHLIVIWLISTLAGAGMFYPYLPGKYDALAVPISTLMQLWSGFGLLLIPIAVFWLRYELKQQSRSKRNLPTLYQRHLFAWATMIGLSVVVILASLLVSFGYSFLLGLSVLALWLFLMLNAKSKIRNWKNAEPERMNYTPLYLLVIPLMLVIFQVAFAAPLTNFSRKYAIGQSKELIEAIERHRIQHGSYPSSLLAIWPDYYPKIVGIEKFYYAPNGEAYNLCFEQPRLFFDNFGTREFVMYNKLDQQIMPSHVSWILIWSNEQLVATQGWYAVHEAFEKHWKYFWFD